MYGNWKSVYITGDECSIRVYAIWVQTTIINFELQNLWNEVSVGLNNLWDVFHSAACTRHTYVLAVSNLRTHYLYSVYTAKIWSIMHICNS